MSTIEPGTRIKFEFLIDFTSYFADNDFDGPEFVEMANGEASRYTARVWTMGNRWIIDDLENGIQCEIELFDRAEVEGPIKMLQIIVCSKH